MVYSAATIQWIPEEIGFLKVYDILKNNGTFAMFMTHTDYKSSNEALYQKIEEIYEKYFKTETPYTRHLEYKNVINYGFTDFERREYYETIEYSSDDYVSLISIIRSRFTSQCSF